MVRYPRTAKDRSRISACVVLELYWLAVGLVVCMALASVLNPVTLAIMASVFAAGAGVCVWAISSKGLALLAVFSTALMHLGFLALLLIAAGLSGAFLSRWLPFAIGSTVAISLLCSKVLAGRES